MDVHNHEQIGEVEVLLQRIYPIDAWAGFEKGAVEVVVEPGVYPLYSDGIGKYWVMTGRRNMANTRLGDGLWTMGGNADPGGPEFTFPSRVFGDDEWREFLQELAEIAGTPLERLKIREYADR